MGTSRRDFFRRAAQLTFLSVMTGGTVYLLKEGRIKTDGCAENRFCANCRKINTCSLDQAKNYRRNER